MAKSKIQHKQSKHCEVLHIVNTPEGYKIVAGNQVICRKTFNTVSEAEAYIGTKPYDILINLMITIFNYEKDNNVAEENPKDNPKN